MKRPRRIANLLLTLLCLSAPAQADIYAFVDQNGVRHLSNVPSDPRYKLVMRTPTYSKQAATPSSYAPSNIYPSAASKAAPNVAGAAPKRVRSLRVNEQNRQRFAGDVQRIASKHRLDPALLHAVISAESSYNPWAVSPKGAMGMMQLMPATADRFGVTNPYDPLANMNGGARYLRWLLDRFNDPRLAVAAYNAGEGAVQKYGNQIPPYSETQNYVVRVMDFYQRYSTGSYGNSMMAMNSAYSGGTYAGNTYAANNSTNPNPQRGGGITIITPRNARAPTILTNSSRAAGSKSAPRTYLTPTGDRVIIGSSSGQRRTIAAPLVVTIPAFAGNDR